MLKKKVISVFISMILLISVGTQAMAAFTDIPTDYPYKAEVDFCQTKGYLVGTSATTFDPNGNLTRGQLAVVWCRFLMLRDANPSFTDITVLKNYYDAAAIVMNSLGILSGTSTTTFSPDTKITREQLAMIAMRTFNLGVADDDDYQDYTDAETIATWARNAVSACINAKVFAGLYDVGLDFKPQTAVTRGELCKLLYTVSTSAQATLQSIEITTLPSHRDYIVGDALDLHDMVVTAVYSNNQTAVVTDKVTATPADGALLTEEGQKTVTVSYTEDGVTKTDEFTVQVNSEPDTSPSPETSPSPT